jgi:hypothetical protein
LLGVAALLSPLGLARRSTRAVTLAFLIQCLVVLRPGYLPYMYVIGILPFAALVVAGGTEQLWRVATEGLRHHEPSPRRWRALATRAGTRLAPVTRVVAALLLVGLATACGAFAAPKWFKTDRSAVTTRLDATELAAQRWLVRNVDHGKRLLVDDEFWIYLVQHGFDSHAVKGGFYSRTVVFYWPFDFDPAVKKLLPNGWMEFDYVVSTQGMRNDLAELPRTARAVAHSHVVVTFGTGDQRIEIRAVDRDQTAPPVTPVSAGGHS